MWKLLYSQFITLNRSTINYVLKQINYYNLITPTWASRHANLVLTQNQSHLLKYSLQLVIAFFYISFFKKIRCAVLLTGKILTDGVNSFCFKEKININGVNSLGIYVMNGNL